MKLEQLLYGENRLDWKKHCFEKEQKKQRSFLIYTDTIIHLVCLSSRSLFTQLGLTNAKSF